MNATGNYLPIRPDWLARSVEPALEPDLPIIDAHHHLYERPSVTYLDQDYRADAASGHNIRATVYMQGLTRYRDQGPEAMKPVGETAFVRRLAEAGRHFLPKIAQGMVSYADLRLGAGVRAVLEAHQEAGGSYLKGIRHLTTWDADPTLANPLSAVPRGLLLDPGYREGIKQLGPLGLSYDAWLFWPQLPELLDLARRFPHTPICLDHCGGVVRIGVYAGRRDEVFASWSRSIRELGRLPNVFVKLGGLGMRINGFQFEQGERPPTSRQLAETWRPWLETCIEAFGPQKAMFESNFPVDKGSYGYAACWNAFKRLTSPMAAAERQALFFGTANHFYRLGAS